MALFFVIALISAFTLGYKAEDLETDLITILDSHAHSRSPPMAASIDGQGAIIAWTYNYKQQENHRYLATPDP